MDNFLGNFQILIFSVVLVLLILFAAFFACAETALMTVNRYRLRHRAYLKNRYAIYLLQLLKRPDRLLGAILIGSTFANILASSLATMIALHYFGERGAILSAIILTLVILIFAEIAPKTLAAIYADKIAPWIVYPTLFFLRLFYPIVWLANVITNGLLSLIRIKVSSYTAEPLSREELRSVVYDTRGKISRQYQNMLLSILDLNKLTVDDVMIPMHEMTGIDLEQPIEKIIDMLQNIYFDWMPVYRENINQVIGVLFTRDLLNFLLKKKTLDKEAIKALLQKPYFVPEGTSLYMQLSYFQQSQIKLAFVVDEYGDIKGLLTLNNILEEIVGDLSTSVPVNKRIAKQRDDSFLVDGATPVREFNRLTSWELPTTGPRTINGLIVEYLEALPHVGTAVLINGYPIEIIHVKDNRVKLARIFPKLKDYKPAEHII